MTLEILSPGEQRYVRRVQRLAPARWFWVCAVPELWQRDAPGGRRQAHIWPIERRLEVRVHPADPVWRTTLTIWRPK